MSQDQLKVSAIVLAAGLSSRMGDINKLLAPIDGTPLIRRAIDQVRQSQADPVIVVTGHQENLIRDTLSGCDVSFVYNKHFAEGLSTSLRSGLAAVPEAVTGALICLGDMPKLTAQQIDQLILAFREHQGEKICVPVFQGRQGNPVLWPRHYFDAMRALSGDAGAKKLIGEHRDHVFDVVMDGDGVVADVDTPEELKKFQ